MDAAPRTQPPQTIDVTLDGEVLGPPSPWAKLRHLWHMLPRGSVPVLVVTILVVAALAVLLLGVVLVAVPVLLVLALLSALLPRRVRRAR